MNMGTECPYWFLLSVSQVQGLDCSFPRLFHSGVFAVNNLAREEE